MQDPNQQIYFVIFMGTLLALLLVGFILGMMFFYQRRRQKQEREMARLKEEYEQEVLRSQLEIQEETMKTIAQELHDNIGQSLSVIKLWMSMAPISEDHEAYEGVQNSKGDVTKSDQRYGRSDKKPPYRPYCGYRACLKPLISTCIRFEGPAF